MTPQPAAPTAADPRLKKRASPEALGVPVTLRLTSASAACAGAVLEVSEDGLRARFPGNAAPEAGARFRGAALESEGAQALELAAVRIERVEIAAAGDGAVATVVPEDGPTRAALWYVTERLATRRSLAAGPAPDKPAQGQLPKIPARGQYTERARLERLEWIRRLSGAALAAFEETRLNPERLTSNIENMIGAVEVPVGIAGPLLFRGQHVQGMMYAPMATTEGALVASATRGATAISRSGGVTTRVTGQRMMRVPLFAFTTVDAAFLFASWVWDHIPELRDQTRLVSRHAKLVSVEPVILGNVVHVYFTYETGDAAGQNMTTACTWHACLWMMQQMASFKEVVFENFIVEANMSGDKKVTFQSFTAGRGTRVVADCLLDGQVMEQVLKITPEKLAACHAGVLSGATRVGMVGYNVNIANIIASIFTATGQDIACVHECSVGQLHMTLVPGGLRASVVLPALIVGTVGGGTHLPGQRAALEMIGCHGGGKVERLAEIIAGFCLALDISTLSAIASGEFATAHERLGRNRPVQFFSREDLSPSFFEPGLRAAHADPGLKVTAVEPLSVVLGSSIVTELTARKVSKLVGLFPLRLAHSRAGGPAGTTDVLVKVKPLDEEVILMVNSMAAMCGPTLAAAHAKLRHRTGFAGCHVRELALYEVRDPRLRRHTPRVFQTLRDDAREAFVLVLERLEGMALMDTADDPSGWTPEAIAAVARGLGEVHAVWLGREDELRTEPWLGATPSAAAMVEMTELWDALAVHALTEFPELVGQKECELSRWLVRNLGEWWPLLEEHPRTLIHNDFNPRNVCLRKDPEAPGGWRLCAYDWELATLHLPQHDLAEFLCFVLPPDTEFAVLDGYLEVHRRALEAASGRALDRERWRDGFFLCIRDLVVNRFAYYLMAHTFRHYGFMERTIKTMWRLLSLEAEASLAPIPAEG